MDADQKTKIARILGYICMTLGTLNLALAGTLVLENQTQAAIALLGTGAGALTIGIIIFTRGKKKPTSEG